MIAAYLHDLGRLLVHLAFLRQELDDEGEPVVPQRP